MPFESLQKVIDDMEKLLENDEGYDVIIYVGENENVKEIHAHSPILSIRSQYFRTTFSNQLEKKDEKFILKEPNISPQFFKIILRFIYCGKVDLTELQGPDALKLLIAVNEFKIQTLIQNIQEYLIKYQDKFLKENHIEILETVCQYEAFTDLWNFCLNKICVEPDILINSDKFASLKAPLLELLLKRDDLSLDEVIVWDSLIKWCFAQHPNISQDVTQWNDEVITTMEKTINRFIPLIRFYHILPEDFMARVNPFEKLISKDLMNNILAFHESPNRLLNVDIRPPREPKWVYDSDIIESRHASIFASWIEKKRDSRYRYSVRNITSWIGKKKDSYYSARNIPYNFNLLYRGNNAEEFHAKCDFKGATITVAKIKDSEHIVGGYNPIYWDSSSSYKSTKDSFIFSFTDRNDFQSAKVSYCNNATYAIGCYPTLGPLFGKGHDINFNIGGNCFSNTGTSYPAIDIPDCFTIDNYEVFQVIKNYVGL